MLLSDVVRCLWYVRQISSDVVRYLSDSVKSCHMVSDTCLTYLYKLCQVISDYVRYLSYTCQTQSYYFRYKFEISVQILSGAVRFCQIPLRFCQVVSDTCLRYHQYRFCQVISDSGRCHMLTDTILHVTMDRPQEPLCRTLAKGPCAGPSPGAHVQDPCQVSLCKTHARCPGEGPSCCCYCYLNCQGTLGEPGGSADFRQQADCMSVAAVIS